MIIKLLAGAAGVAAAAASGPVGLIIAGVLGLVVVGVLGYQAITEIKENNEEINTLKNKEQNLEQQLENLKKAEELLNQAAQITGTKEEEYEQPSYVRDNLAIQRENSGVRTGIAAGAPYNEASKNTNSNIIDTVPGISGTLDTEKDDSMVETMQPGQNGSNEDENERIDAPPNIEDNTTENWESAIQTEDFDWRAWAEEQQQKQWQREDEIRKETQAREDSAYQRAIADMRKAGINPNIFNIQPAQSGGGITQATGIDTSMLSNQLKIDSEKLQQLIDQAFKEDENSKERFTEIFTSLLSTLAMVMLFKK